MNPDPAAPRWTATDLVDSASVAGLAASPRLIRNWVEEGLLDRAYVKGRGPRKGVDGLWSDNQRDLFLTLLRMAGQQDVRRNAPLANVVVWLWVALGDAYVPIRQVRRALRTWAVPARHPAGSSAAATARSVVERLAHRGAAPRARRRFRDVVTRAQAGEAVTSAELVAAARPAIDPPGTDRPRGPAGAGLSAAVYGDYVEFVVSGADAVLLDRGGEELPDFVLKRARAIYRESRAEYATRWREYAKDPDLGFLHSDPTIDAVLPEACRDLVLCIGVILVSTNWQRRHPRR